MTDIPRYHAQPATLDPTQELPEPDERPLAQGHDEEAADEVADAHEKHKQAVEAEARARDEAAAKGEPVPGEPQDPTNPPGPVTDEEPETDAEPYEGETEPETTYEGTGDETGDDVPQGTIDEVLGWVGGDHDRAQRALEAERAGQNRSTLIAQLEAI